jgi:hypothetical protein
MPRTATHALDAVGFKTTHGAKFGKAVVKSRKNPRAPPSAHAMRSSSDPADLPAATSNAARSHKACT